MFKAIIIDRRIRRAVLQREGRGYIDDWRRSSPHIRAGWIKCERINERLEHGTGLTRRDRHIQRAINRLIEIIFTADERKDFSLIRGGHHQSSIIDGME